MTQTNDIPLIVPERSIPAPASIGAEARAALGRAAAAGPMQIAYPPIDDIPGWQAVAQGMDMGMAGMVARIVGDNAEVADTMTIGDVTCYVAGDSPGEGSPARVLLDLHGGALIAGGGTLCGQMAARTARVMDAAVYAPDYRMPPLHPYPTPLDDCLATYRHMLGLHGADRIVVRGTSAGGNLAAALMLRAVAEGLPLPAGLILETPELDLTETGDSFQTNMIVDTNLVRGLKPINDLYAGGRDLSDPLLSPLFGDFTGGFPPTLLTAGTRDLFLSNAVRMLHRLRAAAIPVELLVYEAMPHGGFFGTPEDAVLEADLREFAGRCWSYRAPA